jgi:hypothetical protein
MLHWWLDRRHDGEVCYLFQTSDGLRLVEQNGKYPDGTMLLGEFEARL